MKTERDKCYRIKILTKIGNSNWNLSKKQFCDNEKDFKKLSKQAKMIVDKKNKYTVYTYVKCFIEKFINNEWKIIEEYPDERNIENS